MKDSNMPWWWPRLTDAAWCQEKRQVYEDAADLSDDAIRERYAEGRKYATLWDHTGDSYDQYEAMADHMLAIEAAAADVKLHAWLARFRNGDPSISPFAAKEIARHVDALLTAIKAPERRSA